MGSFVLFMLFGILGCSPDEIVVRHPIIIEPSPSLPVLACTPFVKSGYTDQVSYYAGENMQVFFMSEDSADFCRLTIFNMKGDSVFAAASELPDVQGIPDDASENGFDFPVAVNLVVPNVESGIYFIERRIPFIVKTREAVDVMIVYPSNTAHAYAESGGKSLYSYPRPVAVSILRPVPLQPLSEYCLNWFSTLDQFRIGYVADVDMDYYDRIANAQVLVLVGHSEYWTRKARLNFDQFVDSGGHALILSGNTMWWQVRYSDDERKIFCYRDAAIDPEENPLLKTILWTDPLLDYPITSSIGADFDRGGYGLKSDRGWNGFKIASPSSPLLEGTGLQRGDIISLPTLEYDGVPITGFDDKGYPVVDKDELNFEKIELLGFDLGYRAKETVGTFIAFRKFRNSGIIINTATTDWCSLNGMGGKSQNVIKTITRNALEKLTSGAPVFSQ